jgi:hypothetical protein
MKVALREIGDSSRARGTPVVFMMFPSFVKGEYTRQTYPFAPIVDRVSAVASQAGLNVLDLIRPSPRYAATGYSGGQHPMMLTPAALPMPSLPKHSRATSWRTAG